MVRRSKQRLGGGIEMEVDAQVNQQQPVVSILAKIAEHEGFRRQDRAVYPTLLLRSEDGLLAAQLQQIAMKIVNFAMRFAFGMVQFATFKGGGIAGIGESRLHLGRGKAAELSEKFGAALPDLLVQLRIMIGEKQERTGRAKLLALEKHGRAGRKQH